MRKGAEPAARPCPESPVHPGVAAVLRAATHADILRSVNTENEVITQAHARFSEGNHKPRTGTAGCTPSARGSAGDGLACPAGGGPAFLHASSE